jgi:hypothetical protein
MQLLPAERRSSLRARGYFYQGIRETRSPSVRRESRAPTATTDLRIGELKMNSNIQIEITDPSEFHCFKLTLNPKAQPGEQGAPRIEVMLHAVALVDLIHKCSMALCQWQSETSQDLLLRMTGLTVEELREKGMIA